MGELVFGLLSAKPSEQLDHDYFEEKDLKIIDRLNEAIGMCAVHGIITNTEKARAYDRLVKFINRKAKR